ncbi:dynamin-binding protein-like [Clytia hemisphaerica]|uniref:Dynamin-binding protein n=1 Tax=Clytia hemisphaerica TaxID=252671 RepID=A0A7M5X0Z4_9CNID
MANSRVGIYKCIYNFKAEAPNDLELVKGDFVRVTRQVSSDWLQGTHEDGRTGQFPTNFVELVLNQAPLRIGVVLSNFSADHEDDLHLVKNEVIGIEKDIDSNWRRGFSNNGSGMFPANFVKEICFRGENVDSNNNGDIKPQDDCQYGKAKVIDSFQAQDTDELSINTGEMITLTREIDSFWMEGISPSGQKGKFPKMYVDVIQELPDQCKYKEYEEKTEKYIKPEPQAKALHMFVGTTREEISFDKGDIITLVDRISKDWLVGRVGKTVGRFPSNYVEILIDLPFTNKPQPIASPVKSPVTVPSNPPSKPDYPVKRTASVKTATSPMKPALPVKSYRQNGNVPMQRQPSIKGAKSSPTKPAVSPTKPAVSPLKPTSTTINQHPQQEPPLSPVVAKVVAGSIPSVQKKRASPAPSPTRSASFNHKNHHDQRLSNGFANKQTPGQETQKQHPAPIIRNSSIKQIKNHNQDLQPMNSTSQRHQQQNAVDSTTLTNNQQIDPTDPKTIKKSNSFKRSASLSKKKAPPSPNSTKISHTQQTNSTTSTNNKSNSLQRRGSAKKKAPPPPHQFEFVEEKIFDMYSKPTPKPQTLPKGGTLERRKSQNNKPLPPPKSPSIQKEFNVKSSSSTMPRLPKPLAPMPASAPSENRSRPLSLNFQPKQSAAGAQSPVSATSPVSSINAKSFTVSFSKKANENTDDDDDLYNGIFPRSETDPNLSTRQQIERPCLTPPDPSIGATRSNSITRERPKSLYFASSSSSVPSPEKRSQTLDAVLQRTSSLRSNVRPDIQSRKPSGTTTPNNTTQYGSSDSLSQNSQELKRIDTDIAELKSKIEAEAHLLAGVETLLDIVAVEEKRKDLVTKQEQHNTNIVELNEDLNALEDQKSFMLSSLGKVDDILQRVQELETQIEMYLDNCEQLRLMQDVAIVEELPEIRDSIEFCENMVDTLQDELNGLRAKLTEMGQLEQEDADEEVGIEEQKRKKQMKVIEELIMTETNYGSDISQLLATMQSLEDLNESEIDTEILFGNLPNIVVLSAKLLHQLTDIDLDDTQHDNIMNSIAQAFVSLSHEMKDCYALYCRNYDDAQMLKEKYEQDPVVWCAIANAINEQSENGEPGFNLGSFLIKPVQRVLKYPLLLNELFKNHLEEGDTKNELKRAVDTVTDVATAINEFKRRKDLVLKYRETEDGISKKVQKLNWHSVAKKSSRINQKITQFTGFNSQTVDEKFNEEEKRFRAIEKLIKTILKNINQFVEDFKESSVFERQCAESFHQLLEGEDANEEIISGYNKMFKITDTYTDDMLTFIKRHVTDPLSQLMQLFQAPFRLIQKRHDKCLDYDRVKNKWQRAKDSKERDKINQTEQELQQSENVYTALNAQLLEEMPVLCQKSSSFVMYCLQNFTEARKRYFTKTFFELDALWQLPFLKRDAEIFEVHQERIQVASDKLNSLAYVPLLSNKERKVSTLPQATPQPQDPQTSFFVDLDSSKQNVELDLTPTLIDINNDVEAPIGTLLDLSATISEPSVNFDGDSILVPDKLHASSPTTPTKTPHHANSDTFTVLFDFQAENNSEITLKTGASVKVIRKCDKSGNDEWWLVEHEERKGYILASYLNPDTTFNGDDQNNLQQQNEQTSHELSSASSKFYSVENTSQENTVSTSMFYSMPSPTKDTVSMEGHLGVDSEQTINDKTTHPVGNQTTDDLYILEYDFEALNSGELGAREGQIVNCLARHDQKGNTEWWHVEYDGQQGYIPRDYLTFLDRNQMC